MTRPNFKTFCSESFSIQSQISFFWLATKKLLGCNDNFLGATSSLANHRVSLVHKQSMATFRHDPKILCGRRNILNISPSTSLSLALSASNWKRSRGLAEFRFFANPPLGKSHMVPITLYGCCDCPFFPPYPSLFESGLCRSLCY